MNLTKTSTARTALLWLGLAASLPLLALAAVATLLALVVEKLSDDAARVLGLVAVALCTPSLACWEALEGNG